MRSMIATTLLMLLAGCATTGTMDTPGMMPEADIAGVVTVANEGEIQQGQTAAGRATSSAVRDFANMMVTDHTNALNTARGVFAQRNITPAENDTTRTLRESSQRTVQNLGTYSGAQFDRMYMQSQVDVHSWLLNTMDTVLIPSARTPEMRSLLQTQRAAVAAHLDHARRIVSSM